MALIDLVENFIINKSYNRDLYYEVRDEIDSYKKFIYDNLGYRLIVKEDFIKLEKVPAVAEPWMGFRGLTKKKEYIFFILFLMFLEDKGKEEQFILSSITEYIEENYNFERIDWTIRLNRLALINVLNVAIEIGVIKKTDGEENEFIKDKYGEVLYENTGISRYVVRRFDKDISEVKNYKELLDTNISMIEQDNTRLRRQSVYRKLLLSPVLYKSKDNEVDFEYIKNYGHHIRDNFEKYLGWNLHVHKNAVINVVENNLVKDIFPNKKGICQVILFLSQKIRELISEGIIKRDDNDLIILKKENFHKIILSLRDEVGSGFSKDLREASDERFISEVESYLIEWLMIRNADDRVILLPLIGKFSGKYPKDYKGAGKNE